MKNLDIEKLERKNIYKTPDNFFEKVQANVLMETVHKIKPEVQEKRIGKTPQKQWWIAAAAAVALIFGLGFFLNNEPEVIQQVAQNEQLSVLPTAKTDTEESSVIAPEIIEKNNFAEPEKSLTFVENNNQTVTPRVVVQETKKQSNKTVPSKIKREEHVEQILAAFTSEDLAMISKNMEQDVYLDLYN